MRFRATVSADYIERDSRFAVNDGVAVHYKRSGRGPSMLMLHGSGSSLHTFDRIAAELSTQFDVIRPDLPGFGLTGPRPDRNYTIDAFVDVVMKLLDELSVEQVCVVGNSLGGNVAWNMALDHPERVSSLILINATGYPGKSLPLAMRLARKPIGRNILRRLMSPRATARNLRAAVGPGSHSIVDDALVARVFAMMTRPGNQEAFIDLARTEQRDRTSMIPTISAPTLILRSESVDGQHFAADMPHALERANPATGHLVPDEDPLWVVQQIQSFLTHPHT